MSDAAFKTAKYPGYTTAELQAFIADYDSSTAVDQVRAPQAIADMKAEIERRAKVAAGDVSVMTDGERLRQVKSPAVFLATPDNSADVTVTMEISGNRLVSVLNALDSAMHETGRYRLEGNDVVASSSWFADLRKVTEAMRDELSRQRSAKRN